MKNNNLNVFYVESPNQLINALEVMDLEGQCGKLIIRLNGSAINDNQMLETLSFYQENNCFLSDSDTLIIKSFFSFIMSSLRFLLFRKVTFYVGSFKSKFLALYRLINIDMRLMDDGVATLLYHCRARKMLAGEGSRLNLFNLNTSLNLDKLSKIHEISNHDFSYLKGMIDKCEHGEQVWFYGGKYVESEIFSRDVYVDILQRVRDYFADNEIIYIAHRGENEDNLKKYKEMGFIVRVPKWPSEIDLIKVPYKPKAVAGIYSASLYTAKIIFPHMDVIAFASKELHQKCEVSIDEVNYVYDYYSKYMKVVFV